MDDKKINRACCPDCGGWFDSATWSLNHYSDCPQLRSKKKRKMTPAHKKLKANQDKKELFIYHWRIIYPDLFRVGKWQPITEYKFAESVGKGYQFDWCWYPDFKVAVEVDGGNQIVRYTKDGIPVAVGRHIQSGDYKKINIAQSLGWVVFRFTPKMLISDPVECCEIVYQKLNDLSFLMSFP